MKLKELPKETNLRGVRFKVPKGHFECPLKYAYWWSQWGYSDGKAGVWCKESLNDTKVYPIFLDKLSDAQDWEIKS